MAGRDEPESFHLTASQLNHGFDPCKLRGKLVILRNGSLTLKLDGVMPRLAKFEEASAKAW